MAEGIALLAAYGEDADEEEEDEKEEEARPAEATPRALEAGQEQPVTSGGGEKIGDGVGARPITENGAGEGSAAIEQNGVLKRPLEQTSGWKSPEERRSPKKNPGVSPMGSRAGSKSPLDVGRLGRSPLGQSMGLAGVEETEENERTLEEERAEGSGKGEEDDDDVSDFLPPPPDGRCSDELQRKFAKWVDMLKLGQSYNDAMRRSKPYKNPDFLAKVVAYSGIEDEIGSCFAKEVFDPHGLPEEDYYDNLAAAQRQEAEQREQEKRKLGKLDFVKGGVQAPTVAAATGPDGRSIQLSSIQKVLTPPVAKAGSIPPAAMATAKVTDIRPGKRTKWDKVEDKSGLPPLDAVAVARERAAAFSGGGHVRPTSRK